LRGDDGFGQEVAALLSEELPASTATVLSLHQLTPELAVEVAEHQLVVFVDAACDGRRGGSVSVEWLGTPKGQLASSFWHFLTARGVLALAGELYGAQPRGALVSVGVETTDPGTGLSPSVKAAVPVAAQAVTDILREAASARSWAATAATAATVATAATAATGVSAVTGASQAGRPAAPRRAKGKRKVKCPTQS
jgi:hydrogenase maturation protease